MSIVSENYRFLQRASDFLKGNYVVDYTEFKVSPSLQDSESGIIFSITVDGVTYS